MTNLLSAHWIPAHGRDADLQYFAALNPAVMKTVDADPHRVSQIHAKLGNAPLYLLRDWALSEQKEDMRKTPAQTGVRHAKERVAAARNYNVPANRVLLCGINEPAIWVDNSCTPYTVAFLDELTRQGFKGCAMNLSVGWPANTGADTPPDWRPYEPVLAAIQRGKHYLCLHEYWDHRGPGYNWGWWAGRFTKCPWDVPIIIGECGIDEYVGNPSVSADKRGWHGQVNAEEYEKQVREYIARCSRDNRIKACCLYTTDYSHPWSSFDTEPASRELASIYVEPGAGSIPPTNPPPTNPPPTTVVTHPCAGFKVTQDFYQNPQNYAQFNMPGHNGTDFATPQGTPVKSMADGVVLYAGVDAAYGNYVRVFHKALAAHSFYAHLRSVNTEAGAKVRTGDVIGDSGNTGNSTGPHLHLEVRLGTAENYTSGTPMPKGRVDPRTFLAMHGVFG